MGEYTIATVYKRMPPKTFLSNVFEKTAWDLYEARGNKKRIEDIYRSIGFINNNGTIFDLNMRFIERNGEVYQTNNGVLGSKELPDLTLLYKFDLHPFWLSIVKPNELRMDEHGFIHVELAGADIHGRFRNMVIANVDNIAMISSDIYEHYMGNGGNQALVNMVGTDDLVVLSIGRIFEEVNLPYKDAARKNITKMRKELAERFRIPHWDKDAC